MCCIEIFCGPKARQAKMSRAHAGQLVARIASARSSWSINQRWREPPVRRRYYISGYDRVRELFAVLPEAQAQGLTASAFSFNSGTGRCERCNGTGFEKIEMQFLSDLYVRCAECEGKRFQPHVLKIQLQGKSIHDVLELTVTEAAAWFAQIGQRA